MAVLIFSSLKESKKRAILLGRQAGMKAETEHQGTVGVTLPSSVVVDYFVYPAVAQSVLLTNSQRQEECFRLLWGYITQSAINLAIDQSRASNAT